jgi:hypothetical protein
VHRFERQHFENEEIEGALRQLETFSGHEVDPLRFYRRPTIQALLQKRKGSAVGIANVAVLAYKSHSASAMPEAELTGART